MIRLCDVGMRFAAGGWLHRGEDLEALQDIHLTLEAGEKVGLVGESGSGKTTLGRLMVGLTQPTSGQILYHGKASGELTREEWAAVREQHRMIFQNARNTFDPAQTIGATLAQGFARYRPGLQEAVLEAVREHLPRLGLDVDLLKAYPHQASPGQLKRFSILRVLSGDTRAIVADEPTAGLDLVSAARILALLNDLHLRRGLALFLISHDLDMILRQVDRVYVLYRGSVVEILEIRRGTPLQARHPYTSLLLHASRGDIASFHRAAPPPRTSNHFHGCGFSAHCWLYTALDQPRICLDQVPLLLQVGDDHWTACHHHHALNQP
ncbi:MAG: ABC transporter ATP-binding protein [Candidatus Zixiibacteriota bacterium]|nr:MAG: ABC transporter ATP-binding protein [candidate division Zixibacteria bacterium]